MKKNVGNTDKIFRIIIALLFAGLYFIDVTSGTLGIVLMVLAVVFAVTSFISFCPLYTLFGLNTCPVKKS